MKNILKDKDNNRIKVGLALGSGGAKGIAHIGVLKALVEHDIPIDIISGCSMGATVGAGYASRKDVDFLVEIQNAFNMRDMLKMISDIRFSGGALKGSRIESILQDIIGEVSFKKLKIPFIAVATDLLTGTAVTLKHGSVVKAVRCSLSIPGLFKPYKYKDYLLIDGGATMPLPVEPLIEAGADFIIAVDVNGKYFFNGGGYGKRGKESLTNILFSTIGVMHKYLCLKDQSLADVVIAPDIDPLPLIKLPQGDDYIDHGYRETLKYIPEIKAKLSRL